MYQVITMNRLQYEKSPYLLQHAKNPVDWRPWGPEAFKAARQEDKPVFLSIGYSTCHWCHVMAHESFESDEVAEALNRDYIPIKVDREERPDVDAVYMEACLAMNGSGGWPLTALLTPEQLPFWAGTYLPKTQLLSLLGQASKLWREGRDEILSLGEKLAAHLRTETESQPALPSRALLETGVHGFSDVFDALWGGFGKPPKVPAAHNLLFLLRYAGITNDPRAKELAGQTLACIYRGGIFDHVGGGFSRYSTDRQWLVPHFEKMLYDNALLSLAYTEAWQQSRRPWQRFAAQKTLDYVLRELTDPSGGFYCGQDADSEGVEGKYYVFTPDELQSVLSKDSKAFCERFGVTENGNFHGSSILNLIDTPEWEDLPPEFSKLCLKVYDYRKHRMTLHTDDKVLTAWNGLMIAALARAGFAFDEPRYLQAAEKAVAFVQDNLTDPHRRLLSRWRDGEAAYPGKLDDYAFLSWGLLELYGVTFDPAYLEEARRLAALLLEEFFDTVHGGFYPYGSSDEQLIARKKDAYDNAMPSGNAAAALVLSRLGRLTGEQKWRDAAALQEGWLAGVARAYPMGHAFALLAFTEELWPAGELVCASREIPHGLQEFLRENTQHGIAVLVKTMANADRLAALAPFTADYPIPPSGARYYLCQNGSCRRPAGSLEELKRQIQEI
ncbi:MAG: thioredoxin domain-containing protein [Clostridia bacterium]|nr:thioredoxin domain-containing protein [Clostridia bacterium]